MRDLALNQVQEGEGLNHKGRRRVIEWRTANAILQS